MSSIRTFNRLLCTACAAGLLSTAAVPAHAGFYLQEEVQPMWFKVDLDGDGYVSRDELCAEDPGLAPGFAKADFNGDGKLELREFEILLISL